MGFSSLFSTSPVPTIVTERTMSLFDNKNKTNLYLVLFFFPGDFQDVFRLPQALFELSDSAFVLKMFAGEQI
jgi:hypothetical protein